MKLISKNDAYAAMQLAVRNYEVDRKENERNNDCAFDVGT